MKDVVLCLMNAWHWIRRLIISGCFLFVLLIPSWSGAEEAPVSFLSLSDIHFDPFAGCYSVKQKPCPLLMKLEAAPINEWPTLLQSNDTHKPSFGHDTNYPLFIAALNEAQKAAQQNHAQFVFVLGDFLSHHFKREYRRYSLDRTSAGYYAFQLKTLSFVTGMLATAFPKLDVYPVLGNNDTLINDYQVQINGEALHDIARVWAPLIHSEENQANFTRDFSEAGYYEVSPVSQPRLKIVALNTVIFSPKSQGKSAQTASMQELDWLHSRLAVADEKENHVFMIMHIPMSIDVYFTSHFRLFTFFYLWRPDVVKQYKALISKYASSIGGIFSGHLHSTCFQWAYLEDEHPVALAGTGSVSPIFGNEPVFNIYTYYPEDNDIVENVERVG